MTYIVDIQLLTYINKVVYIFHEIIWSNNQQLDKHNFSAKFKSIHLGQPSSSGENSTQTDKNFSYKLLHCSVMKLMETGKAESFPRKKHSRNTMVPCEGGTREMCEEVYEVQSFCKSKLEVSVLHVKCEMPFV